MDLICRLISRSSCSEWVKEFIDTIFSQCADQLLLVLTILGYLHSFRLALITSAAQYLTNNHHTLRHLTASDVRFLASASVIFYLMAINMESEHVMKSMEIEHAMETSKYDIYEPLESLTTKFLAEVHIHSLQALLLILAKYRLDPAESKVSSSLNHTSIILSRMKLDQIVGFICIISLILSMLYHCPGLIKFVLTVIAVEWKAVVFMASVGVIGGFIGAKWLLVTERSGAPKLRVIIGRKFFHLIALLVSIPIITDSFECCIIGWSGFLFIILLEEIARIYNVFNLRHTLTAIAARFTDDRDLESVVVTPIFLTIGCEMPMVYAYLTRVQFKTEYLLPKTWNRWPDKLNRNQPPPLFLALSFIGILATSVGDSAAALIPNCLKTKPHFIRGRSKTWEGLISFAIAHSTFANFIIKYFDHVPSTWINITCLYAAMIECFTQHVDNYWVSLQSVFAFEACRYVLG